MEPVVAELVVYDEKSWTVVDAERHPKTAVRTDGPHIAPMMTAIGKVGAVEWESFFDNGIDVPHYVEPSVAEGIGVVKPEG